jgi:hypothetical protein
MFNMVNLLHIFLDLGPLQAWVLCKQPLPTVITLRMVAWIRPSQFTMVLGTSQQLLDIFHLQFLLLLIPILKSYTVRLSSKQYLEA